MAGFFYLFFLLVVRRILILPLVDTITQPVPEGECIRTMVGEICDWISVFVLQEYFPVLKQFRPVENTWAISRDYICGTWCTTDSDVSPVEG